MSRTLVIIAFSILGITALLIVGMYFLPHMALWLLYEGMQLLIS